ncbi:MAG: GlsB/YeaQ/YmgE family stress response membrane protein [Actinobacteria bacterium]|nr:GlsB/YeaQ/YmgE family stress response membrane protein [Actinomycetota bacterium]
MWALFTFLCFGFIAGLIGRALVPGSGVQGCFPTALVGMIGSFIGGFLGYVLFGKDVTEGRIQISGIFGSVIGAAIALLVYRAMARTDR